MTDHDAEMDALRDEHGDEAYRLTEAGNRLGYQLSLHGDEGRNAVMEGVLGEGET